MKPPDMLFREHVADALKSLSSAEDTLENHGSKGLVNSKIGSHLKQAIEHLEALEDTLRGRSIQ